MPFAELRDKTLRGGQEERRAGGTPLVGVQAGPGAARGALAARTRSSEPATLPRRRRGRPHAGALQSET